MPERRQRGRKGSQTRIAMRTPASATQVREAWTDPEKIPHWLVDRAKGRPEGGALGAR
jgi:uncharacterized protein YndB with AHSA1/START domain